MSIKNDYLNYQNLCRASKRNLPQIRDVGGMTLERLVRYMDRPLEDIDKLLKFAEWRIEVKNTTRELAKTCQYSYPGRVWIRADTWIYTPHKKLKIAPFANIHCCFVDRRHTGANSRHWRTMNALNKLIDHLKQAADTHEMVSLLNQAVSDGLIQAPPGDSFKRRTTIFRGLRILRWTKPDLSPGRPSVDFGQ